GDRLSKIGGASHRTHAGLFQRGVFLRGSTLAARNDRAGVPHALTRRRRDTGDIRHDRFAHVLANELGRRLFVATADLADHDDAFGLRILFEEREHVDEVHATHRIATDADTRALPEAGIRRLEHRFIRERARARDDA